VSRPAYPGPRSSAALRWPAALLVAAALLPGCRSGIGAVCRCASDCRAGLVCESEGEKTLTPDMCFPPPTNGRCVEADANDSSASDPLVATEPPVYLDLPSRRDFGGDSNSGATGPTTGATTSATDASTGVTTSATDSSSSTGTTGTSTGTTSTTDTSTASTGDSTGTTGTTSGTTGTGTSTTGDTTGTGTGTGTGTTG
jgi:hypothetical protein